MVSKITFLHAAEGVYLSLKGAVIVNNSYVDVADIGKYDDTGEDAALLCNTNKSDCCNIIRTGEWYFPSGARVGIEGESSLHDRFYRNRGPSIVRLNRHGSPSQRGSFRCEVLDDNNNIQRVFVNIGMLFIYY